MTPLLSWMLVITIGVLGGVFAWQFARWLEDREWQEWRDDLEAWRAMCRELDMTEPVDEEGQHPHRGA